MLQEKIYAWFDIFCQKVFGHGMTVNIREFIRHLSWSFLGGISASAILFLTNILAGRWLGVDEYGKYSAVFALAQIFLVFFLVGMDLSITRKLVKDTEEEKKNDISASIGVVVVWLLICGVIFILIKDWITSVFRIDALLISSAFFFGAVLALRQLSESVIRGLHWFKKQAFLRIAESIVIFASFFFLLQIAKRSTFLSYVESLAVGSLVLILLYLFFFREYLGFFKMVNVRLLWKYGKIAFLAGLFGIIFNSLDKLAIARYLDFTQLGIYGAYFTASLVFVSQLGAIFDNVFFPTIAKFKDNLTPLIKKMDQLSIAFFFPFLLGMAGVITVILHFFGTQYPLIWQYVFGFSLLATLKIVLILNTSLITAYSNDSLKLGVVYGNITNLIFLFLFLVYVHFFHLSILSMVTFLVIYTAVFIVLNKWILYQVGFYRKTI